MTTTATATVTATTDMAAGCFSEEDEGLVAALDAAEQQHQLILGISTSLPDKDNAAVAPSAQAPAAAGARRSLPFSLARPCPASDVPPKETTITSDSSVSAAVADVCVPESNAAATATAAATETTPTTTTTTTKATEIAIGGDVSCVANAAAVSPACDQSTAMLLDPYPLPLPPTTSPVMMIDAVTPGATAHTADVVPPATSVRVTESERRERDSEIHFLRSRIAQVRMWSGERENQGNTPSLTHRSITCLLSQYELESQKMREENRRLSADAQREMSKLEMQLQFKVRLADTFMYKRLVDDDDDNDDGTRSLLYARNESFKS